MELKECKETLYQLLKDNYSQGDVYRSFSMQNINSIFGFSYDDICLIIKKRPDLLFAESEDFVSNGKQYVLQFNVLSQEFRNLILKIPAILSMRCRIFMYKIKQTAIIFDISTKDALRLIYLYPALLTLKKDHVLRQIKMLASALNEGSIFLRTILRNEPRLIFADESSIQKVKNKFKQLGFGEQEVCQILCEAPSVVFLTTAELNKSVDALYPTIFNKRDFKSLLQKCPHVLLETEKLKTTLNALEKDYGKNGATQIVCSAPQMIFASDMFFDEINKLGISKNYISSFPQILSEAQMSLGIKLVLSRVMGLDSEFNKFVGKRVEVLASRFLFMQFYGIFEYQNILLPDEEFEKKYSISTPRLLKDFVFDVKTLSRTLEHFVKEKGGSFDIDLAKVLSYLGASSYESQTCESDALRCHAFDSLVKMNFSPFEALYVLSACPAIVNYDRSNLDKIFDELRRFGLSNESIVKMAVLHPSILCCSYGDALPALKAKFKIDNDII